jgi:1-acyl-sn-glycerol-3-phosphate acyltransferase
LLEVVELPSMNDGFSYGSYPCKAAFHWLGIEVEVRNPHFLKAPHPGVIVANHRSYIDIGGDLYLGVIHTLN